VHGNSSYWYTCGGFAPVEFRKILIHGKKTFLVGSLWPDDMRSFCPLPLENWPSPSILGIVERACEKYSGKAGSLGTAIPGVKLASWYHLIGIQVVR